MCSTWNCSWKLCRHSAGAKCSTVCELFVFLMEHILYLYFTSCIGKRFISMFNSKCWTWSLKPSVAWDWSIWDTSPLQFTRWQVIIILLCCVMIRLPAVYSFKRRMTIWSKETHQDGWRIWKTLWETIKESEYALVFRNGTQGEIWLKSSNSWWKICYREKGVNILSIARGQD